jgi:hypothetical protein
LFCFFKLVIWHNWLELRLLAKLEELKNYFGKAHGNSWRGKDYQNPDKRTLYYKEKDKWTRKPTDKFLMLEPGEFRKDFMQNNYREEPKIVARLALKYGDPFAIKSDGSFVDLEGVGVKPTNFEHQHFYPIAESLDQYMEQICLRIIQFLKLAQNKDSIEQNKKNLVIIIAQIYQYAANGRFYRQINNSVNMNFVNLLLRVCDYQSIPHGILDHIAQRFQPKNFEKYFADYLDNKQPRQKNETPKIETETPKTKILAQLSTTELLNYGKIQTGKFWEYLESERLVSEKKLELTQGWVNHSDSNSRITLGTGEMDQIILEKVVFKPDLWKGEKHVIYRLSHEISHKLAAHISERDIGIQNLYGMLLDLRGRKNPDKNKNLGLSMLGNLQMYKNAGYKTQAKEDIVELLNMYILHPNYLKDFLNYLVTENKEKLKQQGLLKITQEVANIIYTNIEKSLKPIMTIKISR